MTTMVTLRLFFYGLVAFTPDEFQCTSNMRALLIDARKPPVASDGCPMHSHTPALFYYVPQVTTCKRPCRIDRGLCRCELGGGNLLDIRRRGNLCFEGNEDHAYEESSSNCAGPIDQEFEYVPKLRPLRIARSRMELNSACDNECPVRTASNSKGMCRLVAAQINFVPSAFAVCQMAGQRENDPAKWPEFNYKPLASMNLWPWGSKQIAEIVRFDTKIEVEGEDPREIELTIAEFEDGGIDKIVIPVYCTKGACSADLVIANFMDEHHDESSSYARCEQDYVARDFELYHDLARQPMYPSDRPIPQAGNGAAVKSWKAKSDESCGSHVLAQFRSSFLRAGDSRPICPQAAISKN